MKKNGNSHHQTWLSVSQWARQPKASSDNKALVLPAQHAEPAESLRLRSSLQMSIHTYMKAYIKEAEEARNLGTRGYRKGGLEREVCNTHRAAIQAGMVWRIAEPQRGSNLLSSASREVAWEHGHQDHGTDFFHPSLWKEECSIQELGVPAVAEWLLLLVQALASQSL